MWLANTKKLQSRGGTYQVVSQQLHDQCRVLVAFLTEGIKLGNSIVEGLLGEVARLVGRVEDLVIEDGEVEGEAETDGVSWSKISLSNLSGGFVCLKRLVGGFLSLLGNSEFSEVAVVIALPVDWNQYAISGKRLSRLAHILW